MKLLPLHWKSGEQNQLSLLSPNMHTRVWLKLMWGSGSSSKAIKRVSVKHYTLLQHEIPCLCHYPSTSTNMLKELTSRLQPPRFGRSCLYSSTTDCWSRMSVWAEHCGGSLWLCLILRLTRMFHLCVMLLLSFTSVGADKDDPWRDSRLLKL